MAAVNGFGAAAAAAPRVMVEKVQVATQLQARGSGMCAADMLLASRVRDPSLSLSLSCACLALRAARARRTPQRCCTLLRRRGASLRRSR